MKLIAAACLVAATLSVSPLAHAHDAHAAQAWQTLAEADVVALCADVRGIHPGMRENATPDFATVVDESCRNAEVEAAGVRSYPGWRSAVQALVMSFRDGHLNVRFNVEPATVRWPGFLIDGRAAGYVVRYPVGLAVANNAPVEGSRLTGCDGVPVDRLMMDRLDGRVADWSKAPERLRQAYRLFIESDPAAPAPLTSCDFETPTGSRTVQLDWRSAPAAQMNAAILPFTRRIVRGIGLAWETDGGAWISLGNVQNEGALQALEAEMTASRDALRAAPYVVFDLRGSAGGNSMWGGRLAGVLWGEEAVEARRLAGHSNNPAEYGKFWRGSARAAVAIRAEGDKFAAQGPDMAEVAAFWRELADEISQRPEGDDNLMMDACCQPGVRPTAVPASHYDGKAYVVTDAGTFSSSIVVMNTFKRMGAVQVGEVSGQNEVYAESVGPIQLPSGLGAYRMPVSLIRQPRQDLGGTPPDIGWDGAMDDDAGLRRWIITDLARR